MSDHRPRNALHSILLCASLSPALRLAPALLAGRKYYSQRRQASFAEGERSYNNAESAEEWALGYAMGE